MAQQFSVSMCVYGKDNPAWFWQAVDSILNQTVPPSEVVLVVDGPIPEELNRVVADYETLPEFRVIRLETNQGLGIARQIGLDECSFDLVAFMDADDISVPNRFEKQLEAFAEDPLLSVVGGNIAEFLEEPRNIVGYRIVPERREEIEQYLKKRCPLNHVTVMLKKSDACAVGGYLDWYHNEDYYLWIRMFLAEKRFANIAEVLVNVRVGQEMYRRRGGWKYFCSEAGLQWYMLSKGVIGPLTYAENMLKRLIVQVLLPNRLRGWVFQRFARKQVS